MGYHDIYLHAVLQNYIHVVWKKNPKEIWFDKCLSYDKAVLRKKVPNMLVLPLIFSPPMNITLRFDKFIYPG